MAVVIMTFRSLSRASLRAWSEGVDVETSSRTEASSDSASPPPLAVTLCHGIGASSDPLGQKEVGGGPDR